MTWHPLTGGPNARCHARSLSRIARSSRISAEDVLAVRRIIYADGKISADEAEWLFELNDGAADQSPEWHHLFIEALTEYVVYQAEPRGYVSDENVRWLISRITRGVYVQTDTELELLINALEKAIVAPDPLAVMRCRKSRRSCCAATGFRSAKSPCFGGCFTRRADSRALPSHAKRPRSSTTSTMREQ